MRVLVAYATVYGSTRGVAERVGDRLRSHGHTVDVAPMVQLPDVAGYEAVVLGSAVHDRMWLPEAAHFARRHARALAAVPLWLFSVGMPAALPRRVRHWAQREEDKILAALDDDGVHPRGDHLFSGVIRPQQLPLLGRCALRLMGGRYGDFREWAAIDDWADGIAADLASGRAGLDRPA